jgi:heat shock protein HslJ
MPGAAVHKIAAHLQQKGVPMKKTATSFLTLSFILLTGMAAFGQKRTLDSTNWKLVEANGRRITNTAASISFNGDASTFGGNTGCNSASGSVDIRGRNIDFGAIRTTKRACKLMAGNVDEGTFLSGLENARRFDVTGDMLRLYDRRGRTLLRFKRAMVESGDATRLDDRKWVLEQIQGRQTFVPLPYAFVVFDPRKMSAGGNDSCNSFGGSYSVTDGRIAITHIIHTMMACTKDNKMSVEQDMLEGLQQADRYEIRDERLMLYHGRELLLTFRGDKK